MQIGSVTPKARVRNRWVAQSIPTTRGVTDFPKALSRAITGRRAKRAKRAVARKTLENERSDARRARTLVFDPLRFPGKEIIPRRCSTQIPRRAALISAKGNEFDSGSNLPPTFAYIRTSCGNGSVFRSFRRLVGGDLQSFMDCPKYKSFHV